MKFISQFSGLWQYHNVGCECHHFGGTQLLFSFTSAMTWKWSVWIRWQPSVITQSTTVWLLLLCFGLAILLSHAYTLILTCFMLPCVKYIIFCMSLFHLWNCVSVHCASVVTFMQLRWLQCSWSDWYCRWCQWRPNGRRLGYLIWVLWLPVNWCAIWAGSAPWRDCGND